MLLQAIPCRLKAAETCQPDTSALAALGQKIDEYVKRLEPLDSKTQNEECDFLISTCKDSLIRQYVTVRLYGHYVRSKLMGSETMAVHIADTWIIPGKVKMYNDIDLINVKIFAEFNRRSLIGMKAPELELIRQDGAKETLFTGKSRQRTILFFYDTGCPNCLAQAVMLRAMLDNSEHDTMLAAVYVGTDSLAWMQYINKHLSFISHKNVQHFWDPNVDSDFQRKYGVLQTPKMLLIDHDGIILGRNLDVPSLSIMLERLEAGDKYEYGNSGSMSMYENLFKSFGQDYNEDDIVSLADKIASRESQDRQAFKEMIGDLMYYLAGKNDGRCKEGEKYLIENYILPRTDIWNTKHDTLSIIGYAKTLFDLLSRATPGSMMPKFAVRTVSITKKIPQMNDNVPIRGWKIWRLNKLPKGAFIMFYSRGCKNCIEYLNATEKLLEEHADMRIFLVEMSKQSQKTTEKLLNSFDLTVLPLVIHIGNDGKIAERYVDFTQLTTIKDIFREASQQ